MTRDEVKSILKDVYFGKKEIKIIEDKIEELRCMREKVTPSYSASPGGGGSGNRIEDITAAIVTIEEDIFRRLPDYADKIRKAEMLIGLAEKADMKSAYILTLRYLKGYSWRKIAYSEHYSWKQLFRIHNKAINEIVNLTKDDTK